MEKIKKVFATTLLIAVPFVFFPVGMTSGQETTNPLDGKIIALDAGHGGDYNGAVNQAYGVAEKDVNLAVVYALKEKIEASSSAKVVLTRECNESIPGRKDRVDLAIEKCKEVSGGKKCDVLVSVHHNGSTDQNYDGTLVIYNEKQDIPLANALHDALWTGLTHNPGGFVDEGLDHGGYGMTVYGHLVSALTEAFYITNDWEAEQYLLGTSTTICDNNGDSINDYPVLIGDRINEEAQALYQGLIDYFSSGDGGNGGGNGGNQCPPGKGNQGKC